jgi:hypothetical protein
LKTSQKTLKKFTKNLHDNPQENQKVISFRKNIKINVYIAMKKGGIGSAVKYYFFFKRDWKSIKFIVLPILPHLIIIDLL